MPPKRVLIIGGGVIGAACAHHLAGSGWAVTLIDRGRFAGACSHANCGLICPSHVLPLAEPGAVRRALRAMFQKDSPFTIRPRLDVALWAWLLRFARQCRADRMMAAARGIQTLLHPAVPMYADLIERHGLACDFERRGLLFAYRDAAAFEAYAPTDRLLSESFHEPARKLVGDDVRELEPALRDGLAGGWYYESDAHLRADRLLAGWRTLLEARGVTIREQCEFLGFDNDDGDRAGEGAGRGGAARAARTSSAGEIAADAFVVATGAWTPLLRRELGCRVPIQPGKGYSITTDRPARCPAIPMIFPETRVAVTPMRSGYRLGSMMEFAGYDESMRPERLALLRRGAEPYLATPWGERVEEQWHGWRPMTTDGLPIIGRTPRRANVIIAAGHGMLGLSMAPATGRLVAELLAGGPTSIDPAPYAVGRF